MAFWKPGSKKPVVPLSLEVDRDGPNGAAVVFNKNASLSLDHQRQRLPIAASEQAILHLVERHSTVIIIGHTGCGKTTQIPQYLAAAGWAADGRVVACTQPRRVAAQTVAARVAQELRCSLGAAVGYSIRFEDVTTKDTRIKFLTDGVLLREMMGDPLLSKYSVIMVDEAHERSLNTDVLLGLLKKVQRRRRDLRLVIASATVDARAFAAFFDLRTNRSGDSGAEVAEVRGGMEGSEPPASTLQPALLSVEGRTHHVSVHYRETAAADFVRATVDTALEIHRTQDAGDILIFLPGQDHIDTAIEQLTEESRNISRRHEMRLVPMALYSALPPAEQLRVFEPLPKGHRKVVVATNIAETSITLEGVVYVVDACFTKETCFDPHQGVQTLMVAPASKANAVQRAGRAGRVRPGHCYRVCTEAAFAALAEAPVPEMQRSDLTGTVLQLKALGIDNILNFDWLSPPPAEALVAALELLHALGALDLDARLTSPLGTFMAELPLEAPLAKALLVSGELQCSEEMLTVAAMFSVQSPWISQRGEHLALDEAKLRFATGEGDLVTYLNVFRAYQGNGENPQWCNRNFLKYKVMARVKDIRKQLQFHLQRMRVPVVAADRNDRTAVALRKAVTAGYFAHAVQMVPSGGYRSLRAGATTLLHVHPSSVLFNATPPHLVYHTIQQTEKTWMLEVCTVDPDWLTELAPHFYERRR